MISARNVQKHLYTILKFAILQFGSSKNSMNITILSPIITAIYHHQKQCVYEYYKDQIRIFLIKYFYNSIVLKSARSITSCICEYLTSTHKNDV